MIRPSPQRGASSSSSACIGARTFVSYTALFAVQKVFVLSTASRSKNSRAAAGHPRKDPVPGPFGSERFAVTGVTARRLTEGLLGDPGDVENPRTTYPWPNGPGSR